MSILGWFLKPKKRMAKKDTKRVIIGKYKVSAHAQNRVVDKSRQLKKSDMVCNLLGKSYTTSQYMHNGKMQYDKINPRTKTLTNLSNKHVVITIHRVHNPDKEIRKAKNRRR